MRLVVEVFSARETMVLIRPSAVVASFASLTAREKEAETGVLPVSEGSLTETLTA